MKALVVGAGKLGFKLASALVDENCDVTVVDNDEKVIDNILNTLDVLTINANALDIEILEELDISTYDVVLATTTNDEANVILSTISKKLGAKYAIARVRDPEYRMHIEFISKELNIDKIINPDDATAKNIEKYLLKQYKLYSDSFADGKIKLVEFNIGVDEDFVGRRVMNIEAFKNLLITAVSRKGVAIVPNGNTLLCENDVILLGGKAEDIEKFDRDHSGVKKAKSIKKVVIIGAGKTGFYLAQNLLNDGVEVTIVEIDRQKCYEIKEKLPRAQIINGDGTDLNLLEEEMIKTFDAFVATTGIDEANLLIALVVKQFGIYKSVAKVSRTNYDSILDRLEVDAVFNTSYIVASEILKHLRGGHAISVNLLLNGQVEATELIVESGVLACGKKLKELNLPEGILIVAVIKNDKIVIPNGETILSAGDRVVVFNAHSKLSDMKKYFHTENRSKSIFEKIRFIK